MIDIADKIKSTNKTIEVGDRIIITGINENMYKEARVLRAYVGCTGVIKEKKYDFKDLSRASTENDMFNFSCRKKAMEFCIKVDPNYCYVVDIDDDFADILERDARKGISMCYFSFKRI